MRVHDSVLDIVGETPLVRLGRVVDDLEPTVVGKLENMNPGGSVKDRIGQAMIEAAEEAGDLPPGGTVVEGTSGNTGVGLAMAAAIKGYDTIFTIPDKMAAEKVRMLKAFGAEVVVTPTAVPPDDPESYYSQAERIAEETPDAVYPNQYEDPSNPEAHYATTGPEIWEATDGQVTHFVCGVGTGGTISGAGKYLKEQDESIRVVGVDPEGSILKDHHEGREGEPHTYKVEGIGEDIIPETVWFEHIDEFVRVGDKESFLWARRLAREEGMFLGGSSGSALVGARRYIEDHDLGGDDLVVVLFPDDGDRYLYTFYSDEWMRENRFLEADVTVRDLLVSKPDPDRLVVADPRTTVREAIEKMSGEGISQLPVIDDGVCVGSVNERDLMDAAVRDPDVLEVELDKVMEGSLPILDADLDVDHAIAQLKQHPAVLIKEDGDVVGIATKYDLVEYLAGA